MVLQKDTIFRIVYGALKEIVLRYTRFKTRNVPSVVLRCGSKLKDILCRGPASVCTFMRDRVVYSIRKSLHEVRRCSGLGVASEHLKLMKPKEIM